MDPLSVTASIIAVLGLAHKITTLCLELHSLKGARQDLARILDEIESLRAVLEGLARLISSHNGSSSTDFETVNKPDGTLARCQTELQNLQADLQKLKSSNSRFGPETISWALNEKDLVRRFDRLVRAKQDLQLALSIDQTAVLLQSRNDSITVRSAIEDVNIAQQRRSIVNWLRASFSSSAFNDARKLRSTNSGDWFLKSDSFRKWTESPRSAMWITGIPGSGKTVLCSSIIKSLMDKGQSDDNTLLLYFFFDFATRDKRMVGIFLRSLLSQIQAQVRDIVEPIRSLYDQHHGGFQEPSNADLLDALCMAFKGTKDACLVIDALDECNERAELIEIVEKILDWELDNVHLLATSRKERDFDECFARTGIVELRLEGDAIQGDIREYVTECISKERWSNKWPLEIRHEITCNITSKAGDMFSLAAFQLEELQKCRTLKTLRVALSSLPTTLEETYSRILSKIEPVSRKDALRILSWLCFAFRPLYLDEVTEVLATDLETLEYDVDQKLQDPEDVLSICGGLVMRSGESGGLKLSHYTVKEYLTSTGILTGNQFEFRITRYVADISIAKTCLVYLRGRNYRSKMEAVALRPKHPLTQYATDFWGEHFGRAGEAPELLSLALELLVGIDSRFPKWAWLSCIIGDALWTEPPRSSTNFLNVLLYYSALIGSSHLMDAMLDRGADINSEGGWYGTALSATAYKGNIQMVEFLLSRGADVNVPCGYCGNALQAAASQGWIEIVQLLVSYGSNVHAVGGRFYSALCAAMYSGPRAEDMVKLLLKSGARYTLAEHHYATTQSVASNRRLKPMFPLQLDKGPDLAKNAALNATPAPVHFCLTEMLLIEGTQYSSCACTFKYAPNGLSKLHLLIDIWKAYFKMGSQKEGRTVLHLVALVGTPLAVQYLLDLGMDINQKDAKGWSAVHYAALSNTPEKLKLLLPKWRLEISEPNRWSPLHLACQRNLPEALDLLSKAGVSPSTVTTSEPQWQWSLYDIASIYQNENLVSPQGQILHDLLLEETDTRVGLPMMQTGTFRICDGCQFAGSHQIIGPTFRCGECSDFDYCFKCKLTAEDTHPHSSWSIL